MFDNLLNTQINPLSDDDLEAALGTGDGKDDKGKKGKTDNKKTDNKSQDNSAPKKEVTALSDKDLEKLIDDDNDDTDDSDDNDDQDDKKGKKKASKKVETKDEDEDIEDEDGKDDEDEEDEDEDEDKKGKKKKDDKEDEDEQDNGPIEVKDFLAARAELLIKKGYWVEWDGWEDTEWDEDTWAEIEIKQRELQREEDREDILDSFGPIGARIADYAANGGDPEKLIEIFKEQKKVENLSIETEDAQKAVVLKYATEFQKMKPKAAQTYINALIADKELETAAEEAKTEMEKELKAQQKQLMDDQKQAADDAKLAQLEQIKKFSSAVVNYVNLSKDIDDSEKKEIIKVLTKYDRRLKDGTPINDFTIRFTEFRKDLPNYIELVRFVLDPAKYKKKAEVKGKSEANEKAFKLIRTANKTKKGGGGGENRTDDKTKGSKFKLLY